MKSAFLFLAFVALLSVAGRAGQAIAPASDATAVTSDNEEIARLYREDQADRQSQDGKPIDWQVVGPRDESRRKRVVEMLNAGELKTGRDYFNAATIFQHGDRPADYLLCHELCVTAVFKVGHGETASWIATAKWLAAASEDRFLLSIGRGQRFGTQFTSDGRNQPWHLDKIDPGVSDGMRKTWGVPTLNQTQAPDQPPNSR